MILSWKFDSTIDLVINSKQASNILYGISNKFSLFLKSIKKRKKILHQKFNKISFIDFDREFLA